MFINDNCPSLPQTNGRAVSFLARSLIRGRDRTKMTKKTDSNAFQLTGSEQLPLGGLIEAATRLSNAGQTAEARQIYQAWIDHNRSHPQIYVAHFNCAALASQMQDQAAAAASLNEAIALNPDFVPAYI